MAMRNRFKLAITMDLDEVNAYKSPMIVGIILVYIATVFVQNRNELSLHAIIGFTIVMIVQLLVYFFSDTIFKHKYWLYFGIQGIITFDYAVIGPNGYETMLLGLIPVLVMQSMILYNDAIKVIITAVFFYSIFCGTIIILNGVKELIKDIPTLIIITIALRVYSLIFFEQVKSRIRTQKVLKELELAYEKVEELTLANERQRMARDLHDTLSQGLAGIIMQLDAVNANLNKNNTNRAQEIIQKSMEYARKTLADARLVIDDLRSQTKSDMDFAKAVEEEIAKFKAVSNTSVVADIRIESHIPLNIFKHLLYIVSEALNNIAKHSEAKNTVVKIIENHNQININIIDDGIGFDVKILDGLPGHYGILGMTERVRAIHGKIKIESKRRAGTNLSIIIPIEKGICEENE
jgi:NarL family two-component system sensor histidine kinase YdfH